jgi:DNA processing protein
MESGQLMYLNAFNCIPTIGPAAIRKVLDRFGRNAEAAWRASEAELTQTQLTKEQIAAILEWRTRINPEQELEKIETEKITVIFIKDQSYPLQLKEIPAAPVLLYIRGNMDPEALCFAVVGTRIPTAYGKIAAAQFAGHLARAGLTIISGLAKGIDAIAHRSALENKAPTIAIVGSGLDRESLYPHEHWALAEEIVAEGGAVLSEFPIGMKASKEKFPQRNRIISGLSCGVLVVEAAEQSGALITARFAVEHNRDVFAIPGAISSERSQGTNKLIQDGAKLVRTPEDILNELAIEYVYNKKEIVADDEIEEKILNTIRSGPATVDEIIRQSALDAPIVNARLIAMEMKQKIRNIGNDVYTINY